MDRSDQALAALGKAIRDVREKQGLTLEALAPQAGTTIGTLGQIERGKANPTWRTVWRIAEALGVSIADLAKVSEGLGEG